MRTYKEIVKNYILILHKTHQKAEQNVESEMLPPK